MSYREIGNAEDALADFIEASIIGVPRAAEKAAKLIELLNAVIDARIGDAFDRRDGRGDYDPDL
jgi:hypothetical protein